MDNIVFWGAIYLISSCFFMFVSMRMAKIDGPSCGNCQHSNLYCEGDPRGYCKNYEGANNGAR